MMDVRWPVFCSILLAFIGCGGGPSASKSYDHLVAAATAISAGDKDTALTELSASIEQSPSAWAYFQRARIYLEKGQESDAVADCQKGLEIDPNYRNLLWLSAELKKPAAQRFKGKLAKPPV
jgi:tetratricopeptide (TPR) repeat protein